MAYDLTFMDTCGGDIWCQFIGLNSAMDGLVGFGVLLLVWGVAFVITSQIRQDFKDSFTVANFSILVISFLFFAGGAAGASIVLVSGVLLAISLILQKIGN